MIRRPPRSTRLTHSFPTRRSSDLGAGRRHGDCGADRPSITQCDAGGLSRGASGAVLAITNTCAVVGFGAVASLSPAFHMALGAVQHIPGDPLIGAAVAVTVIAGLTGSASGGQIGRAHV